MKKKILSYMIALGILCAPIALTTGIVYAAPIDEVKNGACDAFGGGDCSTDPETSKTKVNNIVKTIIDVFSWIIGVIAVIMVIFGGFKYITSGGDSSKVSSAKNTILYAVIGLVIVALAQTIVFFVIDTATSTPEESGIIRFIG